MARYKVQLLLLMLGLSLAGQNIFNRIPGVGGGGGNKPAEQTAQDADVEADEGSIESYLELRAFAEGLYSQLEGSAGSKRHSAFKRKVDAACEADRRNDQRLAYEMNISAKSEVRHVIEDRFRVYEGLYDNPVVQALVNRVGQSVVADRIPQLYTFKLVADPVPRAEALSTGTVWITTGMLAMMKTKAELAYVLAHEAAHIYLQHHRERILLDFADDEYNEQLKLNGKIGADRRARRVGILSQAASLLTNPNLGNTVRQVGTYFSERGAVDPRAVAVEWNRFQEDEADRLAFEWLMKKNMDVEKVPQVFSRLRDLGGRDPGVTLGFLGRSDRIRERLLNVRARLEEEKTRPSWANRLVELGDPDFTLLLAEVQRDNGVAAFHKDMLQTARENLTDSVAVKTQDPTALYFYAKVLMQTARTEQERAEADRYFRRASEYDFRNNNYGSYLHRAIGLLTKQDASPADKAQAVSFLKEYLIRYHMSKEDDGDAKNKQYPPHLETVYDYLARAGEFRWKPNDKDYRAIADSIAKGQAVLDVPGAAQRPAASTAPGGSAGGTPPKPRPTPPPKPTGGK